jgi:hypothetical protein
MSTLILQLVALVTPRHDKVAERPRVIITGSAVKRSMPGNRAAMVKVRVLVPPGVVMVRRRRPGEALASTMKEAVKERPVAAANGPLMFAIVTPSPLAVIVVDPGTNDVPVIVTVVVVPTVSVDGVNVPTLGAGAFTVNVWASLVPAPVVTVTLRGPSSAAASIARRAVIDVLSTIVASTMLMPLIGAIAVSLSNWDPVSVTTTVDPATAFDGATAVSVGAGFDAAVATGVAAIGVGLVGALSSQASTATSSTVIAIARSR